MRIVVPMKAVPDLVEEFEISDDGTDIDREYLKFVLNEWDDQALEEALLLKDSSGAEVVVVGLADDPDIEQALYTAIAKGADSAVKLTGASEPAPPRHPLPGRRVRGVPQGNPADLVITGVQAPDDLDGSCPPRWLRTWTPHARWSSRSSRPAARSRSVRSSAAVARPN